MASPPLVLVTGVSGFLGAKVIDKLLTEGYRVRGTVRSAKVANHQAIYASHGDRVDIVAADDLINGDFTSTLKGVTAVIHVASPLPGRLDAKATIDAAVQGTLNVIRQAQKVGIKHFSITSSVAAVAQLDKPRSVVTEDDWNPSTREEALENGQNSRFVYWASKTLAERAVWEFSDQHPDINITTLNPPIFIGPYAPGFILEPGNIGSLSTNKVIYDALLLPNSIAATPWYGYVDVRDVAGGLVAGIKVQGKNRVLINGDWFDHAEAVKHIATARPELEDRLPILTASGQTKGVIDNTRAMKILGIPPVKPWKESVLDAVDTLIAVEKDWGEAGVDVDLLLGKIKSSAS